jgi:hypothetical protein
VKLEAFFHLTATACFPFVVILSLLVLPVSIVRFHQGWFLRMFFDTSVFIATTCSFSAFFLAAQRALHPRTWARSFLYLPLTLAVGLALSIRSAKATLEAVLGLRSDFVRTPKFQIEPQKAIQQKKLYRSRAGYMPYVEIAFGIYFAFTAVYSIQNKNYGTAPFLVIFVWGFLYTGILSIAGGSWDRLRSILSRRTGPEVVDYTACEDPGE